MKAGPTGWQNSALAELRCGSAPNLPATLLPCAAVQTDLTHVNILAELYCESGQWGPALAICQRAERELLGPDEELPVDLRASVVGLSLCCCPPCVAVLYCMALEGLCLGCRATPVGAGCRMAF